MDNRGYYTMQPQAQQSNQSQSYQSQTQQRVATTTSSGQRQLQYGYSVPEVRVELDTRQQYPASTGRYEYSQSIGGGTAANGNGTSHSLKAQFANQQFEMQHPTVTASNTNRNFLSVSGHDKPDGGPGGGSAAISVCASSNCDNSEHMNEDQYREWLTKNFKYRFDPYVTTGGMPLKEFMEMAESVNFNRSRNLQGLFKRLDKDGNQRVSWDEFFTGMKYTKKSEVSRSKRVINSFIESMTPAAQKKLRKEKIQAAQAGEPIPEESYLEAYNCRPPPLFIPLFYVAVWIFFIIYTVELSKGPEWNKVGWEKGFPYYSPLVFCPSLRQEAWRFVSYMFLHNGYHHVVFNTILSFLLGIPLESVHKAWRVGPVFLIGVTIGAMASSIADHNTMLIGASGGVYALFGAHYATVLMNWEELQDDWLDIRANPLKFLLSGIMRLVYLTLLLILDFGISFYGRYSGTQTLPVSVAAHVGGLLAGFFAGVPILRNIDKKPWESKVSIVCWVVLACMFLFGVFWNIFYKNYPAADSIVCSNTALADSLG
ncbi:hypothetical protein BOX15_Mlig001134g1 [Macrostomum lignano]|uniref:EF-hand domain-containing protein n=1 Tax=Macrostomum lignano TaxID=282301 RepID=A0A267EPM8_9PLAT|nr:hypothetical protein BOX15_Mlig001134g1 [Macrostomum lignano]